MRAHTALLNETESVQLMPQPECATSVFLCPLLVDCCCGVKMRCRASNAQSDRLQVLRRCFCVSLAADCVGAIGAGVGVGSGSCAGVVMCCTGACALRGFCAGAFGRVPSRGALISLGVGVGYFLELL
jgi:hypothetical protein